LIPVLVTVVATLLVGSAGTMAEAPTAPPALPPAVALQPAVRSTTRLQLTIDLPGCPATGHAAVADKVAQRFWLCADGQAVTGQLAMTTGSLEYGLPPIGTYQVFAKDTIAHGIHGEVLERFVAFYRTPRGNRIAFHQYVHQDPSTIGDADQRGASAGCFRLSTADSWTVWDFLSIGDQVVVLTA
jgi:L,D-transpeptidase catalytic domain